MDSCFTAQRHAAARFNALMLEIRRQLIHLALQRQPAQRLFAEHQRRRLRLSARPVSPRPIVQRRHRHSNAETSNSGNALPGHGRSTCACINPSVSSPGTVSGVSQRAMRAS